MGIYDRDYTHRPPGPSNLWESMRTWSISTWIAVVLLAAFVANGLTRTPHNLMTGWVYDYSNFSVPAAFNHGQLWRIATFPLFHQALWLMVFNLAAVIAYGPMVEDFLGGKQFIFFLVVCSLAPILPFVIGWYAGLIPHIQWTQAQLENAPPILVMLLEPHLAGASGATYGILVVAATRVATSTQFEMPGLMTIPINLRLLAWVLFGIVAWFTLSATGLPVDAPLDRFHLPGNTCYFAGAAAGAFFAWRPDALRFGPRRRTYTRRG